MACLVLTATMPVLPCVFESQRSVHRGSSRLKRVVGIYLAAIDMTALDVECYISLAADVDAFGESVVHRGTFSIALQDGNDLFDFLGFQLLGGCQNHLGTSYYPEPEADSLQKNRMSQPRGHRQQRRRWRPSRCGRSQPGYFPLVNKPYRPRVNIRGTLRGNEVLVRL